MSKWDGKFNGTYDTSKYAEHSLEDDILDAGSGKFAYAGPSGELIVERPDRIDVWGEGDGKGNYPHYYYNDITKEHGEAPENRHNNQNDVEAGLKNEIDEQAFFEKVEPESRTLIDEERYFDFETNNSSVEYNSANESSISNSNDYGM